MSVDRIYLSVRIRAGMLHSQLLGYPDQTATTIRCGEFRCGQSFSHSPFAVGDVSTPSITAARTDRL